MLRALEKLNDALHGTATYYLEPILDSWGKVLWRVWVRDQEHPYGRHIVSHHSTSDVKYTLYDLYAKVPKEE
jgi:hypothetical protein